MPDLHHDAILASLDAFVDPLIGQGLVSVGAVQRLKVSRRRVFLELQLGFPAAGWKTPLEQALRQRLQQQWGADLQLELELRWKIASHATQKNLPALPEIRNVIAVSSGKGGVGKSTVAVNLALALQAEGARVGVLDADIYGPSVPRMLGTQGAPEMSRDRRMTPMSAHGLQSISIGNLIDDDQPMVWRGPMATQALMQLLNETAWKNLDYLVVDMPPGTGDIQLTLSQRLPLAGAIVVTTPQDIALLDARKGAEMFRKVDVKVLGVVENMSFFCCPGCGQQTAIFGSGGGERLARETGVELLGQLPLDASIREQADGGRPTVIADPQSALAQRYRDIARRAAARLAYAPQQAFPSLVVSDD